MLCVNTMWRYKKIIFLLAIFAAQFLCAQSAGDSAFFVKYASPVFDLQPEYFTRAFRNINDTAFQYAVSPSKTIHHCDIKYFTVQNGKDTVSCWHSSLQWDNQFRLDRSVSYSCDSAEVTTYSENYLTALKPQLLILIRNGKINSIDSSKFIYNNSGLISTIINVHKEKDHDTATTETRLYDAKGRVVVDRNSQYGSMSGTFTYEFNAHGELNRRSFSANTNGAVLCTDTLIYSYTDTTRQVISCRHLLHIAGKEGWILLDEVHLQGKDHKPVFYGLYYNSASGSRFQLSPGMEMSVAYDVVSGKLQTENREVPGSNTSSYSEFYYSKGCDSTLTYNIVKSKNGNEKSLSKREIRKYDEASGLLSEKRTDHFEEYVHRKKKLYRSTTSEIINYNWSK
ncbi:MAG: hypothetical protein HY064_03095 [Bacteroidetes bacterium]|nr:hypothetical protein [Bacteroidota bacterium]